MIYAIGDIHGHYDKLRDAHALIEEDRALYGDDDTPIVHIGDLCDRGPQTRQVIQYLLEGVQARKEWVVLKGNHDQMFLDFLAGGDGASPRLKKGVTWLTGSMGGRDTLASYGAKKSILGSDEKFLRRARAAVPQAHVEFLNALPVWYRAEGMIFVHAGIRPGFPLDAQDEEDLLWIRDEFLWHLDAHEALIVHGHTPVDEPTHYGNRVNVDTGAGWGSDLVPVVFEHDRVYKLTPGGRSELWVPRQRPTTIVRR
jgi:serine/threonine protein phosphatase 1